METNETNLPEWARMKIWETVLTATQAGSPDPLFLTDQLIKSAEFLGITEASSVLLRTDEASREPTGREHEG